MLITVAHSAGGWRSRSSIASRRVSSRSGWGYYGMAGFSVALDQAQHFRLGVTPMIYRGTTNGQGLGNVPAFETRDKWINVMAEFRFSF